MKKIYYLIHSTNWGDTFLATPTLRYLSKSHRKKINVVTHRKDVFINNPYVDKTFSFDEFDLINKDNIVKYESFTYAGRKDGNGIEKKFAHFDGRQLHASDLGFQLPIEDLEYDFFPDPLKLDIELPEKYVVLHVTTNWPNRTWAYENWVELIKWLKDNKIFTVLIGSGYREILHSSYSDKPLDKECPLFDGYYGLDLTNKGTMSDMWWVIQNSRAIVTMDSAPLHLSSTTDTHIIQLGSAINPAFKRFYRKGDWNYKYHFLGGSCKLFCNTNLFYNIREWGDVNSVPPQPNCLENKPTFECHPGVSDIVNKIDQILNKMENKNYLDFFELLPSDGYDRINFNFKKTTEDEFKLVVRDVKTGLTRDKYVSKCQRLPDGHYWWAPSPGRLENLGDVDLIFYLNGTYCGTERIRYEGGRELILNNEKCNFDYLEGNDYPTFWEIFINGDYEQQSNCGVEPGDVVLDIGANYGFFALNSLEKGASKIYSVEPFPPAYEHIKKLSENYPQINPINRALSSEDGSVTMFIHDDCSAKNCLTEYGDLFGETSNQISVQSSNINTLFSLIPERINFMKVDCEGAELHLFKTITESNLKQIKKMVIETHGVEIDAYIIEKLEKNNFTVYQFQNANLETGSILFVINNG